jgi:hypothetical protein
METFSSLNRRLTSFPLLNRLPRCNSYQKSGNGLFEPAGHVFSSAQQSKSLWRIGVDKSVKDERLLLLPLSNFEICGEQIGPP